MVIWKTPFYPRRSVLLIIRATALEVDPSGGGYCLSNWPSSLDGSLLSLWNRVMVDKRGCPRRLEECAREKETQLDRAKRTP